MERHLNVRAAEYAYKGLRIRTARGVHELTFERIAGLAREAGAKKERQRVLDLGCGSGALSQRLSDAGFRTTSCDIGPEGYRAAGDFVKIDLNGDFARELAYREYDYIVALELIEHLENPLHFLRQVRLLCSPETRIFISFPNIHMWQAVRSFVQDGTFVNWNIWQYRNTRHCTIMTDWLFEEHLRKTGLRADRKFYPARLDMPRTWKYPLHLLFYSAVKAFSGAATRQARRSDTVLFEISAEPVNSLSMRSVRCAV